MKKEEEKKTLYILFFEENTGRKVLFQVDAFRVGLRRW